MDLSRHTDADILAALRALEARERHLGAQGRKWLGWLREEAERRGGSNSIQIKAFEREGEIHGKSLEITENGGIF